MGKGYRGRCSLVGILNCRGWWSREVVVNLVLQQLNIFRRARTAKKEKWPGVQGLSFMCPPKVTWILQIFVTIYS